MSSLYNRTSMFDEAKRKGRITIEFIGCDCIVTLEWNINEDNQQSTFTVTDTKICPIHRDIDPDEVLWELLLDDIVYEYGYSDYYQLFNECDLVVADKNIDIGHYVLKQEY